MRRAWVLAAAAFLVAATAGVIGCAAKRPTSEVTSGERLTTSERSTTGERLTTSEIGLVRGDVTDVVPPDPVVENTSEPGQDPLLPRVYPGTPPLIPHGIADYLPITREENACLVCHEVEEKVEGEATPIPLSHYVDLRNDPSGRRDEIAGARTVCVSCHVPQTAAEPRVENTFGGR